MPSRKQIAGFFVRLILVYGVLVAPWPGVKSGYASLYRSVATTVFRTMIPGGIVRFEPMSDPYRKFDTNIQFLNTRSGARQTAITSSRDPAFFQTIFLISLILATPLPWRRRGWAMVVGLMLLHVFIFGKVLITLLYGFTRPQMALFAPAPIWKTLLSVANRIVVGDLLALLFVPLLIWIVVSFREKEWGGETVESANGRADS